MGSVTCAPHVKAQRNCNCAIDVSLQGLGVQSSNDSVAPVVVATRYPVTDKQPMFDED
jgi:hypothetical protein